YHASLDGGDQERLVTLNSPMHEIVRDTDKVSCFLSSSAKVIIDHRPAGRSFLVDLPENFEGLDPYYDFKFEGQEQVAMLTAMVLNILPKDEFRYARRIWIEKKQFLPLKVEVYDQGGKTIEQVVFTDLQLKAALPVVDVDAAASGREIQHIHKRPPDSFDKAKFELSRLPGGFRQQFFIQMSMHNTDQPVEHLLLTDGFSSVSVYLENKNEKVPAGPYANGSVNAFSKILGDYLVTVIGEVPSANVQYIAEGIKLRTAEPKSK
ncbi:MAG: MucB/RseB C-terminal domain-containing protein, partial [Gammaproteobacteria bacterium]